MSQSAPVAEFDPYYKWLGIPKKDQPPNHYRLLGLEVFERDAEVIDAAANRLMDYLQNVAAGPRIKESQRLLNEISAARLVLLDDKKRSAYDKELKPKLESQKPARAVRGKAAPTPPPAPPRATVPRPTEPGASEPHLEAFRGDSQGGAHFQDGEDWEFAAQDESPIAESLVITSGAKTKTAGRGSTTPHLAPKRKTPAWVYVAGGSGLLAVIVVVIVLALGGDEGEGQAEDRRLTHNGAPQPGNHSTKGSTSSNSSQTANPGGTRGNSGTTPGGPSDPADPATTNPPETTIPDEPAATTPGTPGTTPGTDPAGTDPTGTDPAGTDPAGTDPAGTDPAGTDPATPETETSPDTTTNRLDDLLTAAKEAIEKDDIEGALKHLEEYAALEPVPPMDVQNMLSMARGATSDEMALKFLQQPQITDGHVTAAVNGTLNIQAPGMPEKLLAALTARVRKVAPQEAMRRGLNVPVPPAVANNPPTTPMPPGEGEPGEMPPAQPAADSPLAKLKPNDDPQEFLKQALTKKGTQWLLKSEEDAAIKAVGGLADVNKKYLEARKPIEEVLQYRQRIDAAKRQAPPGAVLPEQVRALELQFGETAFDTNDKVKAAVQAWAAAYNDLLAAVAQAKTEHAKVEAYYQELAADPNVATAVTKARSGKLGPSQQFKAKKKDLDKYNEALSYVPCWRSGQENFIHSLVNGKVSVGFANRPALNISGLDIKATIQIALCEQAGIELGEPINLTFNGGGAAQQIQCRKVTIPSIRIGTHELKDVPALAFPPGATFMANALGEGSFDGYEINFLPEAFRFEIEARGAPPMAE